MVAVVAFVALQFGYIKKPGSSEQEEDKKKDDSRREVSNSAPNLSSIMGGMFEQLGPQIQGLMAGSLEGGKKSEKPRAKKTQPAIEEVAEKPTEVVSKTQPEVLSEDSNSEKQKIAFE